MEGKPKIPTEIRQVYKGSKHKILISAYYRTELPSESAQLTKESVFFLSQFH